MKVRDFCSRIVAVAMPSTDLREAARMMREHHVGSLVVIDKSDGATAPIGVITDRDIVVLAVAPGIDPQTLTVRDVMSPEPAVLRDDCGVYEAAETMAATGARRLPVVTEAGVLLGIVSLDDVLRVLSTELAYLVETVNRSSLREIESRPAKIAGA